MKKSMVLQRLFSLVLAVVLACSCFTGAFGAELDTSDEAINAAKVAMDAAKAALDAAKAELAKADANVATAEANLAAAEKALADAGLSPDAAESEAVAELKKQIEELQKQIDGGAVADVTAQSAQAAKDKAANTLAVAEAKNEMDELAADVAVQEAAVKLTEAEIKQLETEIANNTNAISGNETLIGNAQDELDSMADQKALLGAAVTDAEGALDAALAAEQQKIDTAKAEQAILTQQWEDAVAANEAWNNTLTQKKAALDAKNAELAEEADNLKAAQDAQTAAQDAMDAAQDAFDEVVAHKDELQSALNEAKKIYDAAKAEYDNASSWVKPLLEAGLKLAESGLASAQKELDNVETGTAASALEAAKTKLAEEKAKTEAAVVAHAAAVAAQETAEAEWKAAAAECEAAAAALVTAKNDLDAANKALEEAEAALEAVKNGDLETQKAYAQQKLDEFVANSAANKAALEEKIATLTATNKELAAANESKTAEKIALEGTKAAQEATLAETQAALTTATTTYNDLVKAGEAIDAKIAEIAAEIEKITSETVPELEAQLKELQKQLESAQTGNDKLLADYNTAKAALETAKATQKALALGVPALQIAYDEAASLYAQLTGSTSCAHDKYQVEAFGNVFCPLKTIGLCTHNLGKCCSAMSTSMISNRINEYVAAGDFKGLASEAKSVYNQLTNLVNAYEELPESSREAVTSAINSLVKKAVNLVGDKLLGEENWAKLKELGNTLQNAGEIAGKVQDVVDQVKAEVEAAVQAAVSSGDFSDVKDVIAKAEAALEKIKPYFPELDFDLADVKGAAVEYAKQYLEQLKSELAAKIKDCVANGKLDKLAELAKNIIAKADELKDKLPTCSDVDALIDAFKAEMNALLNGGYKQYVEQIKDALMEQIKNCIDSGKLEQAAELVKKAINKLEELKDQLPIDEEIQKLIDALKAEAKDFINGGYKEYAAAAKEQIKELLQKVLDDECYSYIATKAAELQAKVEKLLSEIHVCEESAEEVAKLVKSWVEEFINDCTAYIEAKLDAVTCESIKAKLQQIADAIENAMGWRPDCDLTEEDIKAIIDALKEMAKECIKEKAEIIEGLIEEILKHITVELPAVEPTCYQTGLTKGLACICGKHIYIEQEVIPATGNHVYCDGEVTTEPTCITAGEKTFHCETEGCVASYTESIPATGEHVYCEGEVTTEPTCITPGVKTFHCEGDEACTATKTETIPATGKHVYESEIVDEPTCCAGGTIMYYCVADKDCDAGYSQPIAPTGEHDYEAVTTEPTCGADGKIVYTCKTEGCTASYEEIIPATGKHVYEAVTTAATCCADGKIVYTCACGDTYEEVIPATGEHVWNDGVKTEPDCIHEGKIDYACTTEGCTATKSEVIPATGEHAWTKVDTVEATCTTGGKKYYECTTEGCDATKTCETGRKGHSYDVWTSNQNGTHSADCLRWCGHVATVKCDAIEAVLTEELTMTVCLVCGDYLETAFELVADATIEAVDKNALPKGTAVVRGMEAPADGVLYAFTAAYEISGKVNPFNGLVSVTVPVDEEIAEFKVIRVIAEANAEEGEELQVEVAYTIEDGKLTVETDDAALFLLVPVA